MSDYKGVFAQGDYTVKKRKGKSVYNLEVINRKTKEVVHSDSIKSTNHGRALGKWKRENPDLLKKFKRAHDVKVSSKRNY